MEGRKSVIAQEIAAAVMIADSDSDFSKGYDAGTNAAGNLDWGVGEVVRAAIFAAQASSVPELKQLIQAIKASESAKTLEGGMSDSDVKTIAMAMLRKAKRFGPMGIAGAMAGVLEDANAHRGAKFVYDAIPKLTETYGSVSASAHTAADQYGDLNDAALVTGIDGLSRGSTEIWYMKDTFYRDGIMGYDWLEEKGAMPDPAHLQNTHVMIGKISERNINTIYAIMQGEQWSPRGEARSMIRGHGISHTSMSSGDVIVIGRTAYIIDMMGVKKLPRKTAMDRSAFAVSRKRFALILRKDDFRDRTMWDSVLSQMEVPFGEAANFDDPDEVELAVIGGKAY